MKSIKSKLPSIIRATDCFAVGPSVLRVKPYVGVGEVASPSSRPLHLQHHSDATASTSASTDQLPSYFSPRLPCTQAEAFKAQQPIRLFELPYSDQDSNPPEAPKSEVPGRISEHEYQTRVGKSCRVLIDTLPDFMNQGVVDLSDLDEHVPSSSSTSSSSLRSSATSRATPSKSRFLPSLSPFLGHSLLRKASWKGKEKAVDLHAESQPAFDSLYHTSISFEFRPPIPHIGLGKGGGDDHYRSDVWSGGEGSAGSSGRDLTETESRHRGGPTICFNGRTMYIASSHILRHALSALFYDTSLHLESARFEGRSKKAGSSWPGITSQIRSRAGGSSGADVSSESGPDRLIIRLRFEGMSRMSSHGHTYTVLFKYEFDRDTGTISKHVVDNIQPVPGSRVWAGLTNAWGALSPCGAGGGPAGGGGAAHCEGLAAPSDYGLQIRSPASPRNIPKKERKR